MVAGIAASGGLWGRDPQRTSPSVMKEISEPRGCVCGVLPEQGPAQADRIWHVIRALCTRLQKAAGLTTQCSET